MDSIDKFLRKLDNDEGLLVRDLLERIYAHAWQGLDLKKLKGYENIYRVRTRKIRIIFKVVTRTPFEIKLLSVSRKDDNTYRLLVRKGAGV